MFCRNSQNQIFDDGVPIHEVQTGPRFNIKTSSFQYRKSHCGEKTVVRSSYLHNGISYTGKMSFLYWIGPLVFVISAVACVETASYRAGTNISSIPPEATAGNNTLMIKDNVIDRIPRDAFITYSNLKYLTLVRNSLRYIEEGAFNGQYKLLEFHSIGNDLQLPTDLGHPTKSLVKIRFWSSLSPTKTFTFPYFAAFENLAQ